MDRGAWQATVHGVTESQTRLGDQTTTISQYTMVAQTVKRLPAMQETQVQFLGREDPLEKETVTHSHILAWEIPCTEEPGELQSMGWLRVGHDLQQNHHHPN